MTIRATLLAACLLGLAANSAQAFEIKLNSVSTTGEVMQGKLHAKMNFSSTFELAVVGSAVTCAGVTDNQGKGKMTCTDGRSFDIAIEGYGKFSGAYVATYGKEKVATGWGRKSDLAYLTSLLH